MIGARFCALKSPWKTSHRWPFRVQRIQLYATRLASADVHGGAPVHAQGREAVPTPLCRRPVVAQERVLDVAAWKQSMSERITSIGDGFVRADNGPSCAELQRELDWVLDDAVAAVRYSPADPTWTPCSWKGLEAELRHEQQRGAGDGLQWQLRLRAPLECLYQWWDRRLEDRVPFQYLISTAHWYKYVLSVGPGVLIPRPETEIFPDLVNQAVRSNPGLAKLPWTDLGTGSGAIAISAADELKTVHKDARVYAVDLSPVAAAYAQANAASVGLSGHVTVLQGSWFDPLRQMGLQGKLGGVLSNPPYIPRADMDAGLQAEVGRHEPVTALDGGEGPGLDSLRPICTGAAEMLAEGGFLALETAGGTQAHVVAGILRQCGHFQDARVVKDCYGVERFVTAIKKKAGP